MEQGILTVPCVPQVDCLHCKKCSSFPIGGLGTKQLTTAYRGVRFVVLEIGSLLDVADPDHCSELHETCTAGLALSIIQQGFLETVLTERKKERKERTQACICTLKGKTLATMSHLFGLLLGVLMSGCLTILRCTFWLLCFSLARLLFLLLLHAHRLNGWAICGGSWAVHFLFRCRLHVLVWLHTTGCRLLLLGGCGGASGEAVGGGVLPDRGLPAYWVLA